MSKTEEEYNFKVEYQRFKKNFVDTVVFRDGEYKVKHKTIISGFDGLMRKWKQVETQVEFLPMEAVGCFKELNHVVYIHRKGQDANLNETEVYLKKTLKIEVENKHNNIFLSKECYRIFLTDVARGQTVPIPMRKIEEVQHIKATVLNEEVLGEAEKTELLNVLHNPKVILKPLVYEEISQGNYVESVPTNSF